MSGLFTLKIHKALPKYVSLFTVSATTTVLFLWKWESEARSPPSVDAEDTGA